MGHPPFPSSAPVALFVEAITKCLVTDILSATVFVIKSHHVTRFPIGFEKHTAGLIHQGTIVLAYIHPDAVPETIHLRLLGFHGLLAFVEDRVGVGG